MSVIYFSFAGLAGSVKTENKINATRNFLPFLEDTRSTNYSFEYISCEKFENLQGKLLYKGKEYDVIQKENGDIIRVFKDHQEDDLVYGYSKMIPFENTVRIFYLRGNEQHFDDTNNSFFHSGWEQVMLWNKRMILHASLIDTAYGGILFSGKSGVGKTTQAKMWMHRENVRQINGDRPILYQDGNKWMGCGSPYAGSSECYVNECIPVKMIILLEQGNTTELQRLSVPEAVKRVYANCTVYSWNKEFVERLINLIIEFVSKVPVYRLVNRADSESVEIVKKELLEEVIK